MNSQEKKELFLKEKEEYDGEIHHIYYKMNEITNPSMIEIDKLYGIATGLSTKNAEKYRKIILWLSIFGGLLTWSFLFYDEAEMHGLIIACTISIIILYFIISYAEKLDCHRKYLEYRVLAESLRVQFFLLYAGIAEPVSEMLPWFIKTGIPWISDILSELNLSTADEEQHIHYWIQNQREYHEGAIKKNIPKYNNQKRLEKIALVITICTYAFTLIIEIFIFYNYLANYDVAQIRAGLKIIIGTAAIMGLFGANYYGKMSLYNKINDSKRMVLLYNEFEKEIDREEGEISEENVKYLAKEFLMENSAWYASQNPNKPDWVM